MPIPDDKRSEILKAIEQVFSFAAWSTTQGRAVTTAEPQAIACKEALKELGRLIGAVLGTELMENVEIKVVGGIGNFPKIPWVSFMLPGHAATRGVYVVLCFDHTGRGIVAG